MRRAPSSGSRECGCTELLLNVNLALCLNAVWQVLWTQAKAMRLSDNHGIGIPAVPAAFANTKWNFVILMLSFIRECNRISHREREGDRERERSGETGLIVFCGSFYLISFICFIQLSLSNMYLL